jgi:dTDP-4-dehydrorhamnose 3,5-epimerase
MGTMKLTDILITPLSCIKTSGGDVLHAMKQSDVGYCGFGEAYISLVNGSAVKAWKRHKLMTMNLVVPVGQVQFVFRGENAYGDDDFRVEEIGENNYVRITVPPGIWFGFQGRRTPQSLVLNIGNIPHDPNEVERLPLSEINYTWY